MGVSLRKLLGRAAWGLPILGAAFAPVFIGGTGHWALKVVSGALFGLSMSLIVWRDSTVPPYSAWLGTAAAAILCMSILLPTVFAWDSDLGSYLVILGITVSLGWALAR